MAAAAENLTQSSTWSGDRDGSLTYIASAMMPIVFWASFRPWPSAMAAPDPIWSTRKPRLSGPGRARRNAHRIAIMPIAASRNPITGLVRPGTTTFSQNPDHLTAEEPAAARVAPTRPPIRLCEDEEGRPRYQVKRFQAM